MVLFNLNISTNDGQWTETMASTTAPGEVSIDVSSLTGSYYINIAAVAGVTNGTPKITVNQIWLVYE